MYTNEEYKIYLKVKQELLKEDAENHLRDWIANEKGCESYDIDDDELAAYDIDSLVSDFEQHTDYFDPTADIWQGIVQNYMEDYEFDNEEEA